MKPDYQRIHELERALDIRDDAPLPQLMDGPRAHFAYYPLSYEEKVTYIRERLAGVEEGVPRRDGPAPNTHTNISGPGTS